MENVTALARLGRAVSRRRRLIAVGAAVSAVGAVIGFIVGVVVPAHVDIVGSDTAIVLRPGQSYDEFGVRGVVVLKRATSREVLGEPLGVRALVNLNVGPLVSSDGKFDTKVLPAYIQAYSDPDELVSQIRDALVGHLLLYTIGGAVAGLLLMLLFLAHRRWRTSYDRRHWPNMQARRVVRAYRRPEKTFAVRIVAAVAVVAALGSTRSDERVAPPKPALQPAPVFDGTPLAGAEVGGLLAPALNAARSYIQTYFGQTDAYYKQLDTVMSDQLDQSPVELPTGDDVAQIGFVTDRHCNTGMDRVVISLMKRYGIKVLVSAGDDAFSGSFSFESACTSGLAQRSHKAGITDVFVGGNHDSAQTIRFEKQQKIDTLTGHVVTVDGMHFLGSRDPRTSRYDQGIQPSSNAAQKVLLTKQADRLVKVACREDGPIIVVAHDPLVGMDTLDRGCGHVTLALDGHIHTQSGPNAEALAGGGTGYQLTGGTAGGAPTDKDIVRTFASRLTVGPLNHVATVNIVSVDRTTGALVGVTEFRFTPDQTVTVTQQLAT